MRIISIKFVRLKGLRIDGPSVLKFHNRSEKIERRVREMHGVQRILLHREIVRKLYCDARLARNEKNHTRLSTGRPSN
jgi:hypothetical protein